MDEVRSGALRAIDPTDLARLPDVTRKSGGTAPRAHAMRTLFRTGRARAALLVLSILYTLAVYAPLIANDRPYRIESVSHAEYDAALASLRPIASSLAALVETGREGYAAHVARGARSSWEEALRGERQALAERSELLRAHASADRAELFDRFDRAADGAVALAVGGARGSDPSAAKASSLETLALAARIQEECAALDPRHPEQGGMPLSTAVSYPLFASIAPAELFVMIAWAACLAAPWWWPRVGRRSGERSRVGPRSGGSSRVGRDSDDSSRFGRRSDDSSRLGPRSGESSRALARTFVVLGIAGAALVASCAWSRAFGAHKAISATAYKQELASGRRELASAVFAPHAMGFSETHPSEAFRPPTWSSSAEISDEGYYVRGARAGRADGELDLARTPQPVEVRFAEPARNSPWRHPLGTDSGGRDLLSRCLWGARTSLSVGLAAAIALCAIGTLLGALAGYCGGWIDACVSRAIEVVLCFPAFFLILTAAAVIDPDRVPPLFSVAAVIALVGWTGVARLVRAEFLRLRELEFVQAARSLGFSPARTVFVHMLPHALGPVLVALAFAVASGILTESALSFLGFGVRDPVPSWGSILNESHGVEHWWIQIFPGLLIFVTVLAYYTLGEGMRDALDPRRANSPRSN